MILSLKADNLSKFASLRHGFYTRQGGVSPAPYASLNCSEASFDAPENIEENRRRIAESLEIEPDRLVTCRQVHACAAHVVVAAGNPKARPEADALVTDRRGLALGILTADCAPVLFVDPVAGVIGAAHAGWRGALDGVIEQTLVTMERLGASRRSICAAIGPCIWQDSYEVAADFPIPFYIEDEASGEYFKPSAKRGHLLFDLPSFVTTQLVKAGIENIAPSPADTYTNEDRFFSHRRGYVRGAKEDGRMISTIMLV